MHWFLLLALSLSLHETWEQEWQPLFLMPSCTSHLWGLVLKTILLWSQIKPPSQGCLDPVAAWIMKMEEVGGKFAVCWWFPMLFPLYCISAKYGNWSIGTWFSLLGYILHKAPQPAIIFNSSRPVFHCIAIHRFWSQVSLIQILTLASPCQQIIHHLWTPVYMSISEYNDIYIGS